MKDKWIISTILMILLFMQLWGGDFALKLAKARAKATAQQKADKEKMRQLEASVDVMTKNRNSVIRQTRPATTFEYRDWLKGYLENGGEITHVYGYKLPDEFRMVIRDTLLLPHLLGAQSLSIVCPAGKTVVMNPLGLGHNQVYYMDGFTVSNSGWIPLYKNIR